MRMGRIGGAFLLGGCLFAIVVAWIVAAGGSAGLGGRDVGGLVLAATLAFGGLGFGLVGLAGAQPLDRRSLRIGFLVLSVGLLVSLAATAIPSTDPMVENRPALYLFLAGGLAVLLGSPLTVIALLLSPGRPRRIGAVFGIGLALNVVAEALVSAGSAYTSIDTPVLGLALVGGTLMLMACAGLGLLAARSGRSGEAVA